METTDYTHMHTPQGGEGPEETLEREDGAVFRRLRAASGVRPGEAVEPQLWNRGREFPEKYNIFPDAVAFEQARNGRAQGTIWTDGSRLEDDRVGAACSWQTASGWTGKRFFLGSDKEVFDAEFFAI